MASKMSQSGTDYGTRGETGERAPKGAAAADKSSTGRGSSGPKMAGSTGSSMRQAGTDYGTKGETGEKTPGDAKASDGGGERRASMAGGVGMGQADAIVGRDASHLGKQDGRQGELKEGRHSEGHFYKHGKDDYKPKA
jgi:hypothetical protein